MPGSVQAGTLTSRRDALSLTAVARNAAGTLRQDILVNGRHRVITDQPVGVGGCDSGPSPHELLPAALAGCTAFVLARYARTKGWELGEIQVDVDYDDSSEPRVMTVDVRIEAELSESQLQRLRKVAAACPVRRSLDAGFEFEERLAGGARAAA